MIDGITRYHLGHLMTEIYMILSINIVEKKDKGETKVARSSYQAQTWSRWGLRSTASTRGQDLDSTTLYSATQFRLPLKS
jgi:hypothetical protein